MKKASKFSALLLVLTMALSVFTSCSGKTDNKVNDKVLVIGETGNFEEKWNPLVGDNAYDMDVLNQIYVQPMKLDSKNVLQDWGGHISYEQQSDGSVIYTVKLKKNMKFSDGKPLTIDDYIFTFYVLSDPNYTGPAAMTTEDIEGILEYYYDDANYTVTVNKIAETVKAKYANDTISEEDAMTYLFESGMEGWWDGNPANEEWAKYAKDCGYEKDWMNVDIKNADAVLKLLCKIEYDTCFSAYDPATWWTAKLTNEAISINLKDGIDVKEISGIKKVDDLTCTVKYNSVSIVADRAINLQIVPKHYYGKEYEKGNVKAVQENLVPLGSGPYKWIGFADNIVTLQANNSYFEGKPKVGTVKFQYIPDADLIAAIANKDIDFGEVKGTQDNLKQMDSLSLHYDLIDNPGYGYMAIQCKNIDLAVRKGLMCLMNREPSVKGYYKDLAAVIERPMTTVLAEYPKDAKVYYAYDPTKALEYFKAAGYEQVNGKLVKGGKQLVIKAYIGGDGVGDHPGYAMLTQAANDLKGLGGEIQINDVPFNVLQAAVDDLTADIYIMAWGSSTSCDKSTIYKTGGSQNDNNVSDPQIDKLLDDIVKELDLTKRQKLVSDLLDKVMDQACELPLYQRKLVIAYNPTTLNMDTVVDGSTFYDMRNELWKVDLK
jgi:peptide/nickel transport system substrate-binding protein